jgi:protein gp37
MSKETGISWTNSTWNPLRGCTEVSPGCAHCYAATLAARFSGAGQPYEGLAYFDANGKAHWTGKIRTVPEKLDDPIRWTKPRMIFVNSMSDLFHEDVPDEFIDKTFAAMALAGWHTFQVLTKRANRLATYFSAGSRREAIVGQIQSLGWRARGGLSYQLNGEGSGSPLSKQVGIREGWLWPLPNVWLGVSAEDQRRSDERIPHLLRAPAAVRFVSYEPALGPVNLGLWRVAIPKHREHWPTERVRNFWVIVGGESGQNSRPFDLAWARSVIRQCKDAGVPVFVKQIGAVPVGSDGETSIIGRYENTFGNGSWRRLSDSKGGDMEEWPADLRVREFPEVVQVAGVQGSLF